jgi:filamentous hemagglutinin
MTLDGRSVTIDPGLDDSKGKFEQKTVQDGLTLSLGGSVINAIQTAQSMASAGSQSKDGRVQALAAATTALAARNAASDIAKNGLNVSISLTAGHSENQYTQTTSNVVNTGSVLTAGNDITIRATGGGKDSNINVVGSEINAQGNVKLQADNEVNLVAAQDREAQHSDTKSMSAAAGIGSSIGTNGMSIGFTANASLGRGKEDGEGTTQLNSHVNAGKQLEIVSGADTNIKGAVATGQKVVMNVGGDLNIESLQDTAKFDSKNQSVSVGGTVGVGVSVNGSFSNSSLHSDYASVQEQSGIRAGSDGFQITVKGNTDLKGAVVTSTQDAIEQHKNTLSTGSLTVSDIENHADYKGQSVGLSGGFGTKGDKGAKGSEPDTTGVAEGIWKPMQTGGTGMNTPIAMAASDSASSTTLSGISGADITITDEQKQQELTGKTGEEALAGLNRDVSSEKDSSGALKPIFDKAAIEAAFAVTNAFGQQANALLQEYAQEADEKLTKAKQLEAEAQAPDLTDAQREERTNQAEGLRNEAAELAGDWGPKGTYRQVTTALIAAASGNVTGSAAQFGQTLLVNYAQQQGAAYLGSLVEKGELTEGTPLHAAVHAMLACAGAAASSQQCTSGAAGAAASSLLTQLFADPTPDESKADAEAKRNLIASLVAGIATATDLDASAATSASVAATDNNWLATQQVVQMNKELTAAKGTLEYLKVLGKWGVVSMNQTALTKSGFVKGLAEAGMSDLQGMVDFFKDPVAGVKGLKAIVSSEEVRGQVADDFLNELTTKLNAVETALRVGGETNAEALGKNVAELIWQVGGLVSGVGDVAKAAVTLAKVGVKVTKGALATLGKAAVEGKLIPGMGGKIATAPSVPKIEPVTYTPATVPKDNPGVPKSVDVTPESGGLKASAVEPGSTVSPGSSVRTPLAEDGPLRGSDVPTKTSDVGVGSGKPTDTLGTAKSVENPTLSEVTATPKDGAVHDPGNGTEAYNPEPSDGLSADPASAPDDSLHSGDATKEHSPQSTAKPDSVADKDNSGPDRDVENRLPPERQGILALAELEPVQATKGGHINASKIDGNAYTMLDLTAAEEKLALKVMREGDNAGTATEELVNMVASRQGLQSIPGGKYGANKGFDHVFVGADGAVTLLIDSKQLTNGSATLGVGAGKFVQLTDEWIDAVLGNLPDGSAAKAQVQAAHLQGKLVKGVAGVDRVTGKLSIIRVE